MTGPLKVEVPQEVSFEGRRILVISPRFFGYEARVVKHLQSRGAHVDWIDDRPGNSILIKTLIRLNVFLMKRIVDRYYTRMLAQFQGNRYDDLLVISPESCHIPIVQRFRKAFPMARFILYMWDSFENKKPRESREFIRLFDKCLTFDEQDAGLYSIGFRPLFYSDESAPVECEQKYAFSFIGTIHSDRYRILRELQRQAREQGVACFIYPYLHSRFHYWAFRLLKPEFQGTRPSDFRFEPLPYPQVLKVMAASQAILDIEHPGQRGLTMRTVEVLGAGKKLVTTNASIRQYSFFDSARIGVLDRAHPSIDATFFRAPGDPGFGDFARCYSLTGWADSIFQP